MVKQYSHPGGTAELCHSLGLPRSSYYYQPRTGKRGAKPSTCTLRKDGSRVSNTLVLTDIRAALNREFCCYGYQNITSDLRDRGYVINPKKVYRLMDENNLLLGKVIRTSGKREFVKYRVIKATRPMEYLCLDIKYIWVAGEKRNYFLLTILDVYTRKAVEQLLQSSIRQTDVINLFRKINNSYDMKGVIIRNDNGSQFIAGEVRQFLRNAQARQEFTHVATPEENAYIEAFHSIVQREVVDRFEFSSYYDARVTFKAHWQWYNDERKHGQIGRVTPQQKWEEYETKNGKLNFATPGKAEAGNAGEQPARNSPADGDKWEGAVQPVPSSPITNLSLSPMPLKNSNNQLFTNLICFTKSVQTIGG